MIDAYCTHPPGQRPGVGDAMVFVPSAFVRGVDLPLHLRGRVINVNDEHHHFTVAALCNGAEVRECSKFR